MSDTDQMDHYVNRIHELDDRIAELESRNAMLTNAVKSNHDWHTEMDEYGGYPDSELCELNTKALSATSDDTEAWLQAEILKRLGEPVGEMACDARTGHVFNIFWYKIASPIGTKLYVLPSPLATLEEND